MIITEKRSCVHFMRFAVMVCYIYVYQLTLEHQNLVRILISCESSRKKYTLLC